MNVLIEYDNAKWARFEASINGSQEELDSAKKQEAIARVRLCCEINEEAVDDLLAEYAEDELFATLVEYDEERDCWVLSRQK